MDGRGGNKIIGPDYFSVRWVGEFTAAHSEVYTFHANTDDGMKLYVNGLLITNHWYSKCSNVDGTIALVKDTLYEIKLEYLELTGNATMQLYWSSLRQKRELLPSTRLFYTRNMTSVLGPDPPDTNLKLLVKPDITCACAHAHLCACMCTHMHAHTRAHMRVQVCECLYSEGLRADGGHCGSHVALHDPCARQVQQHKDMG